MKTANGQPPTANRQSPIFASMNISLKGKTALICGSSQGIGLAAAKELAHNGARCILMARNAQALRAGG